MYLIFQKFFLILWRAWFYILASIPVLILFPILASLCFLKKGYNGIFWIARYIWSPFVLFGCGFYLRIKYKKPFPKNISHILVSNHTSYLDPFIMFRVSKTPFVFVGKKELSKIPIFGFIYKRAAILVDRSDTESRKNVYIRAKEVIKNGYNVCIFPERNYLDNKLLLNTFKRGAFKISVDHQIPIIPMVFLDCKRKFPWHINYGFPGQLRVKTFETVNPKTFNFKIENLNNHIRKIILDGLISDPLQSNQKAIELEKKYLDPIS